MRKYSASTTRRAAFSVSSTRLALIAATVFGFSVAASPDALGATHHQTTIHHAAAHGISHSGHTVSHTPIAARTRHAHEIALNADRHGERDSRPTVIRHGRVERVAGRGYETRGEGRHESLVGPAYLRRARLHERLHERLAVAHYRHSYLQCVPYAREVSHIELSGNAFLWWAEAAGRYARGDMPAEGAVLNFRAIGRMPLGHVAVVTAVLDSRTILVTQANWVPGTITNDVTMEDVSPANDWSEVEVELGDSARWGAAYPTYGFIYNHPDTVIASAAHSTEVAEAPSTPAIARSAPDRNLQ